MSTCNILSAQIALPLLTSATMNASCAACAAGAIAKATVESAAAAAT